MIWMDNARVIAIFAVVLLHVSAGVVVGYDVGSGYWWFGNVYDSMVRWCVPVLVMISGGLLLDPDKNKGFLTFYKNRMHRILIPMISWSLFFLFWAHWRGDKSSVTTLAMRILTGQPHYHMWFLYMILGLYLFAPFMSKIVAHSSTNELIFFVCVGFAVAGVNSVYGNLYGGISQLFFNWFLLFVPYFFLGYLIRRQDAMPSDVIMWAVFILSVIATSLGCYFFSMKGGIKAGLYFYDYLSVTVIPMSISAMYLLKTWTRPIYNRSVSRTLSTLMFGVYLVHPIVLELMDGKGVGTMWFHPMLSVPVITVIVFFTSLLAVWIVCLVPHLKRIF
jgi:surface polysaccharide O-acyltransferase-like enzyme